MTLRGKDYCNCDHVQLLKKAIVDAKAALDRGDTYGAGLALREVIKADLAAARDYDALD